MDSSVGGVFGVGATGAAVGATGAAVVGAGRSHWVLSTPQALILESSLVHSASPNIISINQAKHDTLGPLSNVTSKGYETFSPRSTV